MPRLPRINLEGAIYYVTAKGAQNQELFKDKADYKMYLELLAKYKKEHQFKLFSYSLLPDHLELLIETSDDATISEIMHDLNSLYTKYFNGRHGKRGHLFDARFKSVLAEKARMLLALTRHIHLSPSDNAKDYPYSSFHIYVSKDQTTRHSEEQGNEESYDAKILRSAQDDVAGVTERLNINDEIKEVLYFLKDKDNTQIYERYCLEGDSVEIGDLRKKLKRGQIVGSEAFQAAVRNRIKQYSEEQKKAANLKAGAKPNRLLVIMIGFTVLTATPTAVFLYISKRAVEHKYEQLLKEKELEFSEKTRFEKRSPIALTELDGTEWTIEMVPLEQAKAGAVFKDKILFNGGRFSSSYFGAKGFRASSYFLVPKGQGTAAWQTAQSDPRGGNVRWSGDWRGDAMKGTMTVQYSDGRTENFSFFSGHWAYLEKKQ